MYGAEGSIREGLREVGAELEAGGDEGVEGESQRGGGATLVSRAAAWAYTRMKTGKGMGCCPGRSGRASMRWEVRAPMMRLTTHKRGRYRERSATGRW